MKKKKLREPGEFTFPQESKYLDIEEYAPKKRYFLNLVVNEVPEFFEDMNDKVVPILYELLQKKAMKGRKKLSWQEVEEKEFFSELKEEIIDLKERYNLKEKDSCKKDWISIAILDECYTLIRITNYDLKEEATGSSEVDYIPFKKEGGLDDIARKFMEEHREELSIKIRPVYLYWDPLRKRKTEKKKEIKKEIMEEVEKELDRICEFMKEKGFNSVTARKDQFRYLVLFQVKEMSFGKIADLYNQENSNPKDEKFKKGIKKAVKRRAEEIELKRRTKF